MLIGLMDPMIQKRDCCSIKKNILLDPYARAVTGQGTWGSQSQEHYHARVVKDVFDCGTMPQSKKELNELVIYELHVRGFTKHPSSGVRQKGTFAGLKEKIPYLKELGINAVELMPIFEFDETMNAREVNGKTLGLLGIQYGWLFCTKQQLYGSGGIQS